MRRVGSPVALALTVLVIGLCAGTAAGAAPHNVPAATAAGLGGLVGLGLAACAWVLALARSEP